MVATRESAPKSDQDAHLKDLATAGHKEVGAR